MPRDDRLLRKSLSEKGGSRRSRISQLRKRPGGNFRDLQGINGIKENQEKEKKRLERYVKREEENHQFPGRGATFRTSL